MNKQRMTIQKRIILEELGKTKKHPTAEALYSDVKKRLPEISIGTVYRNLELLAESGKAQSAGHAEKEKESDFRVQPAPGNDGGEQYGRVVLKPRSPGVEFLLHLSFPGCGEFLSSVRRNPEIRWRPPGGRT